MRPHPLPLTGERTLPGIREENYWFQRHLACYEWAASRLAEVDPPPGVIVDAGAGEGYGSAALTAATGRPVVAIDLDTAASGHAGRTYPRVDSIQANLIQLPVRPHGASAAVSFQVIEHLWDVPSYLAELARCTAGPIAVSTPNRPVHSPGLGRGERPVNPFHVREFDGDELCQALLCADPDREVALVGVRHGPTITAWEDEHGRLPDALLGSDPGQRAQAEEFAEHLTAREFLVDDAQVNTSEDLVAWWQLR